MKCKNDKFIHLFIKDRRFIVTKIGIIFTTIPVSGNTRSFVAPREKGFRQAESGHRYVKYKGKWIAIHRIVFLKFIGKLNPSLEINHIDGDPTNNSVGNLEMITTGQNLRHSYEYLGRKPNTGARKLLDREVLNIRKDKIKGKSLSYLAEKYGVSKSTISYVVNYKTFSKL